MISRIAFIFTMLWALPCLAVDVTFMKSNNIRTDYVLLSDIAELSDQTPLAQALGSQIVETSPEPGTVKIIDAREIIKKIEKKNNGRLNGVTWQGSSLITITRESVTIRAEKIQQLIDGYLSENKHLFPDTDVTFTPDSKVLPFEIQSGELSWDIIPSSPAIIGSTRFSIIFKVDEKVRKNFSVRGQTKAIAPVVITTRRLKYGDIITPDMVTLANRDISSAKSYSHSVNDIIGSVVKRTIQHDSIIGPASVELPPVIKRGEMVKILVNHSGLKLTATGIAKSDGRTDEVIRVKNTSSNKLIYCRVEAPGIVEVRL